MELQNNAVKEITMLVMNSDNRTKQSFLLWADELVFLSKSNLPVIEKVKKTFSVTIKRKEIISDLLKKIWIKVKKHGWDKQSKHNRVGILFAAATVTVFGGQTAGIAAFGGAIAVPLWIVFGAGAAFISPIIENIKNKDQTLNSDFIKDTINL